MCKNLGSFEVFFILYGFMVERLCLMYLNKEMEIKVSICESMSRICF
jgi:hypothetical protein